MNSSIIIHIIFLIVIAIVIVIISQLKIVPSFYPLLKLKISTCKSRLQVDIHIYVIIMNVSRWFEV